MALLAAGSWPRPLTAQDTLALRGDTAVPDTGRTRWAPGYPLPPVPAPPGPLPPAQRYVFTRDSILWSSAQTLADLLTAIPGVYVARAGFLGQPEYVQYAGRGAAGVKLFWDGVPVLPLGGDTLGVDPGRVPLTYLRRVDVEVLPTVLRVHLLSERHELAAPRSIVRIMSGSFRTAAYTGLFQKHWSSGVALDLAADFVGTDGASGAGRSDQAFDVWAKLGWTPNGRVGASYQLRRQRHDRDPVSGATGAGPAVPASRGVRSDALIRLFAGTGAAGLGLRAEAGVAASAWQPDSGSTIPEQHLRQAFAAAAYARPTWHADVTLRTSDRRTPFQVDGHVGWIPIPGVVLAGHASVARHEGDRTSRRVDGSLGWYRGPLSLTGTLAAGETVPAPAVAADTVIATLDRALVAGLTTPWLSGRVGLVRRDAYEAPRYDELPAVYDLGPSPAATMLTVDALLRPIPALALSGWYADPVEGGAAAFEPPRHLRAQLTFRSKFWRTFRSGALDVKLQVAAESWGAGTAGRAVDGTPVALPAATFWEYHIEVQLVAFTAFWNLRNALLTDAEYVPGLTYPGYAQTFGVTWVFRN